MDFIRNVFAVVVGLFIFSIISFFGFIIIVGAITSASNGQVQVKDNAVMYLNLTGEVHELIPDEPLAELFEEPPRISLLNTVDALREAQDDDRIKGLHINVGLFSSGYASLTELRDAIIEFKSKGKFVYAYGEFYSEKAYYLTSVADSIFIHPEGSLEFNGISANVSFFQGALEKLNIEAQIFRAGDFKSAVEPFMRKDLSDENRLQLEEWLTTLNEELLDQISASRDIPIDQLREISSSMLVTNSKTAQEYGLINGRRYTDQVKTTINNTLGQAIDDDINFIAAQDYYQNWRSTASLPSDRIAVVVAEGEIMGGEGDNYQVGSKKFVSTIRKLRENELIKAMVIRINSPGGGMTASDAIWREITLAKDKMPVIASMGDYATSGGYYLAMPCDEIVSQPTSLTGSIGVFGMLFNFGPFLSDKLGITHDVVKTGEYSDIFTVTRSLNLEEREIIQKEVLGSYETFIDKAANGRGVANEDIKEIASGRIWAGSTALELNLVDKQGGLSEALNMAARSAELEEYQVVYYPEQKTFFEELMSGFGSRVKTRLFSDLGIFEPYRAVLDKVKSYRGIQARMPFELEIN
ncbi:MAG: signal peptide peptidase SppA [Cyclobacteriaceae bacterium]